MMVDLMEGRSSATVVHVEGGTEDCSMTTVSWANPEGWKLSRTEVAVISDAAKDWGVSGRGAVRRVLAEIWLERSP